MNQYYFFIYLVVVTFSLPSANFAFYMLNFHNKNIPMTPAMNQSNLLTLTLLTNQQTKHFDQKYRLRLGNAGQGNLML